MEALPENNVPLVMAAINLVLFLSALDISVSFQHGKDSPSDRVDRVHSIAYNSRGSRVQSIRSRLGWNVVSFGIDSYDTT